MRELFGTLADGTEAYLYTIQSRTLTARITDYGATPVSLLVHGQEGHHAVDVMLGFASAAGYEQDDSYMAAVVGRFASRIADAHFFLNGTEYHTDINEGKNTLHSGYHGYHKRIWQVDGERSTEQSVTFSLQSPDGDQGFPGNADLSVTYEVNDAGEFRILYNGICDQDTPVNLTNHIYWNLNGAGSGDVCAHRIRIPEAPCFTPIRGGDCIPTGMIQPVQGTIFDFSDWKEIGQDIRADEDQVRWTKGYDHNFCFGPDWKKGSMTTALEAVGDQSGIRMTVRTGTPGFLLYAGCNLAGQSGKGGSRYEQYGGFCVETQYYPNCVNEPEFPSCILRAGEEYREETVFRFE